MQCFNWQLRGKGLTKKERRILSRRFLLPFLPIQRHALIAVFFGGVRSAPVGRFDLEVASSYSSFVLLQFLASRACANA